MGTQSFYSLHSNCLIFGFAALCLTVSNKLTFHSIAALKPGEL